MHGPRPFSGSLWALQPHVRSPTHRIHKAVLVKCAERSFAGDRLVAFNMHAASAETGPAQWLVRKNTRKHLVMGLGYFCCSCIAPSPLERHECDDYPQPHVELALLEDLKNG